MAKAVIAPPSIRAGGAYRWLNALEPVDAPDWLIELARQHDDAGKRQETPCVHSGRQTAADPVERDLVAAALELTPADKYQTWLEIGAALYFEFGDAGFELFDRWSAKSSKYDAEQCTRKWTECGKLSQYYTGATIFFYAEQAAPGWRANYEEAIMTDAKREAVATVVRFNQQRAEPAPDEPEPAPPWPTIDDAAFHGLAGDAVRLIGPHSEADPVALLLQFLAMAGSAIGRGPYYQVEADHHHANLFAVLVGATSKARKGTSAGRISAIVKIADDQWTDSRVKSGLSSGEGLINEVRDPVIKWDAKEQAFVTVDQGVTDKRLLVIEPEFAGALSVMERHGNTVSSIIRQAWDGATLQTLTRSSPLRATGAHISIIGHITVEELRARLSRTDTANGFANRFLFALVRRSQQLPFGGDLSEVKVAELGNRLKQVIDPARAVGRVEWGDAAKAEWVRVYGELSADRPGLLGAVTARAEAQAVRLATIYALLDQSSKIEFAHLRAALALWDYCDASAAHVFGSLLGDPVADEILRALKQAGAEGMTRTAISGLFDRHHAKDRIGAALALLQANGRARVETRQTVGRPVEVWYAK